MCVVCVCIVCQTLLKKSFFPSLLLGIFFFSCSGYLRPSAAIHSNTDACLRETLRQSTASSPFVGGKSIGNMHNLPKFTQLTLAATSLLTSNSDRLTLSMLYGHLPLGYSSTAKNELISDNNSYQFSISQVHCGNMLQS
jgi:hypothetical protein